MSLSTCAKCGGHIPLGPHASNRCESCGTGVFVDLDGPAKVAYDRVMVEVALATDKYMREPEGLGMLRLIEVCAFERAARIINDVGMKGGGGKDAILMAIQKWLPGEGKDGINFAHFGRQILHAMSLVSAAFREADGK